MYRGSPDRRDGRVLGTFSRWPSRAVRGCGCRPPSVTTYPHGACDQHRQQNSSKRPPATTSAITGCCRNHGSRNTDVRRGHANSVIPSPIARPPGRAQGRKSCVPRRIGCCPSMRAVRRWARPDRVARTQVGDLDAALGDTELAGSRHGQHHPPIGDQAVIAVSALPRQHVHESGTVEIGRPENGRHRIPAATETLPDQPAAPVQPHCRSPTTPTNRTSALGSRAKGPEYVASRHCTLMHR